MIQQTWGVCAVLDIPRSEHVVSADSSHFACRVGFQIVLRWVGGCGVVLVHAWIFNGNNDRYLIMYERN